MNMKANAGWFVALTVAAATILVSTAAPALEAGVGVADITPDVTAFKVPLAGYGARLGAPAKGVHDPLHAKVLYLRDAETHMALITCDLRSCTPEFKGQIVQKCAEFGLTPDNTLVACSHTHDGPAMYAEKFWQMQFGKYDPKIVDIISSAVAKAVGDAVKNAAPAKLGFAEGMAEGFTHNRRWGYDAEKRKEANEQPVVNPRVWILRVDAMDGQCRAVLVNFASHPTILDSDNLLVSAEWPGVAQRELENAFPGATAFFTNGAEGDQSPSGANGADNFARMEDYGARFAKIVESIASKAVVQASTPISFSRTTPELPPLTFPEGGKRKFGAFKEAAEKDLPRKAEIQVFRLGPVALIGFPGEPILETGHAVEQAVAATGAARGIEKAIVLGLSNDYIGYLVNEKEYAHGGYEVDSRSYYGPGLCRFLAEQAAQTVKALK